MVNWTETKYFLTEIKHFQKLSEGLKKENEVVAELLGVREKWLIWPKKRHFLTKMKEKKFN